MEFFLIQKTPSNTKVTGEIIRGERKWRQQQEGVRRTGKFPSPTFRDFVSAESDSDDIEQSTSSRINEVMIFMQFSYHTSYISERSLQVFSTNLCFFIQSARL